MPRTIASGSRNPSRAPGWAGRILRDRSLRSNLIRYALLTLTLIVFLFPLAWIVGISLKSREQIFANTPLWIWDPTLENYMRVLQIATQELGQARSTTAGEFAAHFLNSLIVSTTSVLASLVIGVPAAYSFSRFRFRGNGTLLITLLVMRMLPPIAVLVPMYVLFRELGLLDTHIGLSLAYVTFSLPLVVWIMRGFFDEMPVEIEESALIDGCSRFGAFWRVVLPLTRPGIVAATIFSLVLAWNDFLFAAVLTSRNTQTLPVMMAGYTTDSGIAWGDMTASAVLVILPVILFSVLTQRHLVTGLASGAVKG